MTVCPDRRWVAVVSRWSKDIPVFHLDSGLYVKAFGRAEGSNDGIFNISSGSVSFTRWGTLLVADDGNNRVVEMDPDVSLTLRSFPCSSPVSVDRNEHVLAVSHLNYDVSVVLLAGGIVLARLGSAVEGGLSVPYGVRLLADGSGVAVCDCGNNRVVVFSLNGSVMQIVSGLSYPVELVECDGGAALLVLEYTRGCVTKVSRASGAVLERYRHPRPCDGQLALPSALALLPDGTLVVRGGDGTAVHVFTSLALRIAWLAVTASWQRVV